MASGAAGGACSGSFAVEICTGWVGPSGNVVNAMTEGIIETTGGSSRCCCGGWYEVGVRSSKVTFGALICIRRVGKYMVGSTRGCAMPRFGWVRCGYVAAVARDGIPVIKVVAVAFGAVGKSSRYRRGSHCPQKTVLTWLLPS